MLNLLLLHLSAQEIKPVIFFFPLTLTYWIKAKPGWHTQMDRNAAVKTSCRITQSFACSSLQLHRNAPPDTHTHTHTRTVLTLTLTKAYTLDGYHRIDTTWRSVSTGMWQVTRLPTFRYAKSCTFLFKCCIPKASSLSLSQERPQSLRLMPAIVR